MTANAWCAASVCCRPQATSFSAGLRRHRGRHVYIRQLRDMKLSANVELFDTNLLEGYARLCGWILARAHAKASGKAIELTGYIGGSDRLCESMTRYGNAYADQVEKDYERFLKACRSGRLEARTDEDMAADFHV